MQRALKKVTVTIAMIAALVTIGGNQHAQSEEDGRQLYDASVVEYCSQIAKNRLIYYLGPSDDPLISQEQRDALLQNYFTECLRDQKHSEPEGKAPSTYDIYLHNMD